MEEIQQIENTIDEIISSDELNKILSENTNVLVNFYAPWCTPCRFLDMELRKLIHLPILKIVKINKDLANELFENFGIQHIPTLKLYINNEDKITLLGYSTNHIQTILQLITS